MKDLFVAAGTAALVLFFAVCAIVYVPVSEAGLFAKKLPTLKTLVDEYNASFNSLAGELGSFIAQQGGTIDEDVWTKCANNPKYKSRQLLYDMGVIIEYYRIIEGDQEVADNFRKWKKEFDKTWPKDVKEVEACYSAAFSL